MNIWKITEATCFTAAVVVATIIHHREIEKLRSQHTTELSEALTKGWSKGFDAGYAAGDSEINHLSWMTEQKNK